VAAALLLTTSAASAPVSSQSSAADGLLSLVALAAVRVDLGEGRPRRLHERVPRRICEGRAPEPGVQQDARRVQHAAVIRQLQPRAQLSEACLEALLVEVARLSPGRRPAFAKLSPHLVDQDTRRSRGQHGPAVGLQAHEAVHGGDQTERRIGHLRISFGRRDSAQRGRAKAARRESGECFG
jgi:hypothetical protein